LQQNGSIGQNSAKKYQAGAKRLSDIGGGWWIRTTEGEASRFTVCPLWPLGKSPIRYKIGAGGRIRTPDLLITNQLLYQLSYTSKNQRTLYYQTRIDLSTRIFYIICTKEDKMNLYQMSISYRASAEAIRCRIRTLSEAASAADNPEDAVHLRDRIRALRPMLQEANELSFLLAHYYEKGYHRNEHYSI
jgi:hypothetical protein